MAKTKSALPEKTYDYEVEEDLRAVARAHGVRKDPERFKRVKVLAREKIDEQKRKKDEAQHVINLAKGEGGEQEKT